MTEAVHPVLAAADRYRQQVLRGEDAALRRLTAAYLESYRRLAANIQALQAAQPVGPITRGAALRLATLQSLQAQIQNELARFGVIADNELIQLSREGITLGLQHSTGLVEAYFQQPAVLGALRANFAQLVPEQVEPLLGFLADDSPLRQGLVSGIGPAVTEGVSNAMVDGLIRGINPNDTARIIQREYGMGLTWAINTVRTANLWSYREATRANYIANRDIVDGWTWYATLDRRTCASCIAQHGRRFPVDAVLNDHHQGRCVAIPELPLARQLGLNLPEIEPGEVWFGRLDEPAQVEILGPGMYRAWRAGAVQFDQLSVEYNDPTYGPMRRVPSMRELGLEEYYQR